MDDVFIPAALSSFKSPSSSLFPRPDVPLTLGKDNHGDTSLPGSQNKSS